MFILIRKLITLKNSFLFVTAPHTEGNYKKNLRSTPFQLTKTICPFVPNAPLLYTLKTSENLTVF